MRGRRRTERDRCTAGEGSRVTGALHFYVSTFVDCHFCYEELQFPVPRRGYRLRQARESIYEVMVLLGWI